MFFFGWTAPWCLRYCGGMFGWLPCALVGALGWSPQATPDHGETAVHRPLDAISVVDPPSECLTRERLADHVVGWLGRDAMDQRVTIEAFSAGKVAGFRVFVDGEVRGERRLEPAPAGCDDLHAALGLAIAFAIDATILESLGVPQPPKTPEATSAPTEVAAVRQPLPEQRPRTRVVISPRALAGFGILPTAGFGAEASIDVHWVSWLDVVVGGLVLSGIGFSLGSGRVRALLGATTAALCPGRAFGRVRLRLCTGMAAGAVRGAGVDYVRPLVTVIPYLAVTVGATVRIRLTRHVSLDADVRALVPVIRPSFEALEDDTVLRRTLPPIGGLVAVGPSFGFP